MPNPKGAAADSSSSSSSGNPPSNNLWVGNLTTDTSEADLSDLFRRYGVLDTITNYSSRNFAFVHYKRVDDARKAKDSLQNALLRGNNIKIEYARPAKPCKNLWVGSISTSVTKDQLENEFSKCGRIEDFKFLRDRNSALVEYYRLEDAVAAVKSMNGRRLGGEQIRVDFVRSHPSRRENLPDFHDSRDGNYNNRNRLPPEPYWEAADAIRKFPESSQFGNKMHAPLQYSGGWRDGLPSKVLWVGYPPSVLIDEQMLHNAMILFGEIERITSFPSRHFSFVEFRSVDEARRAKEGLQGRLFNDPRIHIMFASNELAPSKDIPGGFAGISGPRPDMFFNEPNFVLGQLEFLGHNRPMALNDFAAPSAFNNILRPNMLTRPFGPQAGLDQIFSRPEVLNELAGLLNFQEVNPNGHMVQNWRKPSPAPGLIPPSPQGMRPLPPRPMPSMWEESDPNVLERESKRLRIDGSSPFNGISFPGRLMDDNGIRGGQSFGLDPQFDRGVSTPVTQGQSGRSPLGHSSSDAENTDSDFCWRGIIAKGGTPVCHARCVPIGKGLNTQLPGIVNCSARTGLDMLAKHYVEASGFDIVFFLPDSEDDFASYTEFLRYLGAKNRAGVAKFDDGTTLFLVPPSDFLTKILKISGPERLYGVFLKLPQQKSSLSSHQQQSNSQSLFNDRHHPPRLQTDQISLPPKDDQVLQTNYSKVSHEGAMSHFPKSPLPPTEEPSSMLSFSQDYARTSASIPQAGLSLTPELIATLTSLLPGGMHSSTSAQIPSDSVPWEPTSLPASVAPEQPMSSHGWTQGHQVNIPGTPNHSREEQTVNYQHFGYQFNSQAPYVSHIPAQLNAAHSLEDSASAIFGNSEGQDPSRNMTQQSAPSSWPANNIVAQLQVDASVNPQMGYGSGNQADTSGVFHPSVYQQPKPSGTLPTQEQGINASVPVSGMSSETDNVNAVLPDRVQQLQSALSGAGQGTADGEAEKNQRYQSTLQFAASLLLQIQQQQQQKQGNSQAGNHQQ